MTNITKDQLVYDILTVVMGGKAISDDSILPLKHLSYLVDNTRATIISRDHSKRFFINPDIIQTLGCVDVELVDKSLCPCEVTGCSIYRTNLQIPKTIEGTGRNLITRVGSVMLGTRPFDKININRTPYIDGSKFTKDYTRYFQHDGYIYLLSTGFHDKISISAVFEMPEEAARFSHCNGTPCYTDSSPYPVSRKMVELIKSMIIQSNIAIELNALVDNINDASGTTGTNQGGKNNYKQAQVREEE